MRNYEFLFIQSRVYPKEVFVVLKEALRSWKEVKRNYEVRFIWKYRYLYNLKVKDFILMLDSLNDIGNNIDYQTFLLDILSLILQSSNSNSTENNNHSKIIQELFSFKGGNEMKKSLIRFALKDDKPLIIFKMEGIFFLTSIIICLENDFQSFLQNNPRLNLLEKVKLKESQNEPTAFFLSDIIDQIKKDDYILYIAAFINLINNAIVNRDVKLISKVFIIHMILINFLIQIASLGLTHKTICTILDFNSFLPFSLMSSFLILYNKLYLDRDPFVPISEYVNRCIKWKELDYFSESNPFYYLLNNDDIENPEGGKVENKEYNWIENKILNFWDFGIQGEVGKGYIECFKSFIKVIKTLFCFLLTPCFRSRKLY